jgi:nitrate reductase gamma subunit
MHACLSWGGMLAFALTFLSCSAGFILRRCPTTRKRIAYICSVFWSSSFPFTAFADFLHFNLLNIAAVILIVGLVLSVKLRMSDRSELAIQSFADDVFPVLLLFAVTVTGLMLTVSAKAMDGYGFPFIGMAHAASVIALLLFLPFGKLFHIVQRPLSLGCRSTRKPAKKAPVRYVFDAAETSPLRCTSRI